MRHLTKTAVLCVCITLCALSGAQAENDAKVMPEKKIQAHKVIQINKMVGLTPKDVTVLSGTTVIWMNHSDSLAEIQFTGKAITIACKSPTHFVVDNEGSFISDRIPQGAVASLCFIEKGTYNYLLKRGPRSTAAVKTDLPDVQGMIVVK